MYCSLRTPTAKYTSEKKSLYVRTRRCDGRTRDLSSGMYYLFYSEYGTYLRRMAVPKTENLSRAILLYRYRPYVGRRRRRVVVQSSTGSSICSRTSFMCARGEQRGWRGWMTFNGGVSREPNMYSTSSVPYAGIGTRYCMHYPHVLTIILACHPSCGSVHIKSVFCVSYLQNNHSSLPCVHSCCCIDVFDLDARRKEKCHDSPSGWLPKYLQRYSRCLLQYFVLKNG